MLLKLSFPTLLACVLVVLCTQNTEALPHPKRSGGVTLPLKRVQRSRSDVHPQILLQQHINRSNRRLARMTGRTEPTTAELHECLTKRVLAVEGPEGLTKRYNRVGLPSAQNAVTGTKGKTKTPTKGQAAPAPKKPVANQEKASKKPAPKKVNNSSQNQNNGGSANGNSPVGAGKSVAAQVGGKASATAGVVKTVSAAAGKTASTASVIGKNATVTATKAGAKTTVTSTALGTANTTTQAGAAVNSAAAATNGTAANGAAALGTVTDAVTATAANSLGLDIEANDVGYLATIQMGTPPQDFLILMDSGSADLWVGGENCQSEAGGGCGNHKFLGTQSSSTFQDSQTPFSVTYGTGDVSGTVITDNIAVAGLQLTAHQFGATTSESADFTDDSTPFDGLMGLAQSTLSEEKVATPVEALAAQGLIAAPITSYKISRLADNKNDGEITFGALDTTKFDPATLVTLPNVNQDGFWEGALDAVSVDGTDLGFQGRTAILDTGTTLIVAPSADADTIHQSIQGAKPDGQGGFTVPCQTTASVALKFGGQSFAIDPRDIAFQPVDANDPTGDCISGITAGSVGGANEWLVGDVFLKNAYFSTDVSKNTVQLAKLV